MNNPYRSPATANEATGSHRRLPFSIGNVVGRYLQLLAVGSAASMLFRWWVVGSLRLDLSFVLLLMGGAALRAHSNVARRCVIGVSALVIVVSVGLVVRAYLAGTDGMSVRIGREIENPTIGAVALVSALFSVLAAAPLGLLLTRQARIEFAKQ
ncbi:hypothetical protein [Posidoniimonas corsicana]|nr:hypothetical protein [Posidoniimonas corsicana]